MSGPECSEKKKETISDNDMEECMKFFTMPLPQMLHAINQSIADFEIVCSASQQLERACLLFDFVGAECVKDVGMETHAE
ncbi:hypothetical protein RHVP.30 [Cricetid gammaherpesvirus 2]|uniref:Uncharacterized protein n=1 Tax=Cricetid gammaherpesvirus 2 TaxID=1605972 RepID=E9M5L3_9GAMA|nr:hypothetical protein RHVP.30 [Cricetid gammaherpesvirus 2]ADW24371.1 hypothetical protein RHVP.30 [Cricetid gammaherpesvirus 2]ADW24453.1 hypothetical protein RHVP-L.30 [Cricetid gammaherpesvirus 2]